MNPSDQCCQNVSNVNPTSESERLIDPVSQPGDQDLPHMRQSVLRTAL